MALSACTSLRILEHGQTLARLVNDPQGIPVVLLSLLGIGISKATLRMMRIAISPNPTLI